VPDQVALVPECTECGAQWLPGDLGRWHAYLGVDEDLDESAEVGFYCPDCAEREFGGA